MSDQLKAAKMIRENGRFAMRRINAGHRSEAALMDVLAYTKQLEAANERHVLHHIESICEACGHTKTEDGCANCLRLELKPSNDSVSEGNV